MIIEKLRSETKEAHQALEKSIIPKLKNIRGKKDYLDILYAFYGFFKPVETYIHPFALEANVPNYDNRRKSGAIATDITDMGGSANDLHVYLHVPPIHTAHEALGAMYVLEGSTLGGKIISRMIAQSLGITNNEGISFFSGYGDATDVMWNSFVHFLNTYPANEQETVRMIDAAKDTFDAFKNWIAEYDAHAAEKL